MNEEWWQKPEAVQKKLLQLFGKRRGEDTDLHRGIGITPKGSVHINVPDQETMDFLKSILRDNIDYVEIEYGIRGQAIPATEKSHLPTNGC